MTETVLHYVAKGMRMDPEELANSPGLRQLMEPYVQWMEHAPHWMQFAGLLVAKKCHRMILGQSRTDTTTAHGKRNDECGDDIRSVHPNDHQSSLLPPPTTPEPTPNEDRWMSPLDLTHSVVDVDAIPDLETTTQPAPEDFVPEDAEEDPQTAAYLVVGEEEAPILAKTTTTTPPKKPRTTTKKVPPQRRSVAAVEEDIPNEEPKTKKPPVTRVKKEKKVEPQTTAASDMDDIANAVTATTEIDAPPKKKAKKTSEKQKKPQNSDPDTDLLTSSD